MASLKEIKNRISSVRTTRKITQARQMISSAKLHKEQGVMLNSRAYASSLSGILYQLPPSAAPVWYETRTKGAVAVVIMSSDSGMCGAFNSRMEKEPAKLIEENPEENFVFYPVGKKISDFIVRSGYLLGDEEERMADKISYAEITDLAKSLAEQFAKGELKSVKVLYYNFHHASSQNIRHETLLPFRMPEKIVDISSSEYIMEPAPAALAEELVSITLRARLFAALSSNRASEHAARMIAMQLATENANDILDELQLAYNKLRQQNITAELLDIIGSSFA